MNREPYPELQIGTAAAAHLEFEKQAAVVGEPENCVEPSSNVSLGGSPLSEDVHRRPTALIDLPVGIDVVFIEELDVD